MNSDFAGDLLVAGATKKLLCHVERDGERAGLSLASARAELPSACVMPSRNCGDAHAESATAPATAKCRSFGLIRNTPPPHFPGTLIDANGQSQCQRNIFMCYSNKKREWPICYCGDG